MPSTPPPRPTKEAGMGWGGSTPPSATRNTPRHIPSCPRLAMNKIKKDDQELFSIGVENLTAPPCGPLVFVLGFWVLDFFFAYPAANQVAGWKNACWMTPQSPSIGLFKIPSSIGLIPLCESTESAFS